MTDIGVNFWFNYMPLTMKITLGKNKKGSVKLNRYQVKLPASTAKGMRLAGAILQGQMQRSVTGVSATIDKSRQFPGAVSGKLRNSIKFVLIKQGKTIGVRVGPNVVYAAIHEFGGTIQQTVTEKQRWFFGLSKKFKQKFGNNFWLKVGHVLTIVIPKRPFVFPAWEKKRVDVIRVISREIARPLK